jgi:hypothetical protein
LNQKGRGYNKQYIQHDTYDAHDAEMAVAVAASNHTNDMETRSRQTKEDNLEQANTLVERLAAQQDVKEKQVAVKQLPPQMSSFSGSDEEDTPSDTHSKGYTTLATSVSRSANRVIEWITNQNTRINTLKSKIDTIPNQANRSKALISFNKMAGISSSDTKSWSKRVNKWHSAVDDTPQQQGRIKAMVTMLKYVIMMIVAEVEIIVDMIQITHWSDESNTQINNAFRKIQTMQHDIQTKTSTVDTDTVDTVDTADTVDTLATMFTSMNHMRMGAEEIAIQLWKQYDAPKSSASSGSVDTRAGGGNTPFVDTSSVVSPIPGIKSPSQPISSNERDLKMARLAAQMIQIVEQAEKMATAQRVNIAAVRSRITQNTSDETKQKINAFLHDATNEIQTTSTSSTRAHTISDSIGTMTGDGLVEKVRQIVIETHHALCEGMAAIGHTMKAAVLATPSSPNMAGMTKIVLNMIAKATDADDAKQTTITESTEPMDALTERVYNARNVMKRITNTATKAWNVWMNASLSTSTGHDTSTNMRDYATSILKSLEKQDVRVDAIKEYMTKSNKPLLSKTSQTRNKVNGSIRNAEKYAHEVLDNTIDKYVMMDNILHALLGQIDTIQYVVTLEKACFTGGNTYNTIVAAEQEIEHLAEGATSVGNTSSPSMEDIDTVLPKLKEIEEIGDRAWDAWQSSARKISTPLVASSPPQIVDNVVDGNTPSIPLSPMKRENMSDHNTPITKRNISFIDLTAKQQDVAKRLYHNRQAYIVKHPDDPAAYGWNANSLPKNQTRAARMVYIYQQHLATTAQSKSPPRPVEDMPTHIAQNGTIPGTIQPFASYF